MDPVVTASPDVAWIRRSGAIGRFLCSLTFVDGLVVMVGWVLDLPLLPSMLPGAEATKPDTAAGLMAGALAWLLLQPVDATERTRLHRVRVGIAQVLAGAVVLIGAVVLAEIVRGEDIGFDTLFAHAVLPSGEPYSQQMSASAGVSFILMGAALLWLTPDRRRAAWPVQLGAHIILFSAIVPLAGYLYDSVAFRSTPVLGTTALPTALGLLAMSVALMAARPAEGVMRLFTSAGPGGQFARTAVVVFVVIPFVINWSEVSGELRGWYPQRIGWILESGLAAVVLLGLTWWVAAALDRRELERLRLMDALSDSESRFRQIAETIDEVFWMATVGVDRIVYVSPAYERVWGRSCKSLYHNPRSFFEALHPDDRGRVIQDLTVRKKAGQPFDIEYRIVRPDGEIRWIWDRGLPVPDQEGHVHDFVGVAQDITARKQRQEELRRSVERFELAARATHDAIWDVDLKTGVAWWSDTYYDHYGYSRETIPTVETWADHIHPDDRQRVTQSFNATIGRGDDGWSEHYRYKRADGSYADVFDRAYIVRDADGAVSRVTGAIEDTTERRHLERQLLQAQKMEAIGQLAGGVAHDFNNLLTIIHGFAEFIVEAADVTSDNRESALEIVHAAERAAALTRQLLLFSRRQVLQRSHFDVNDALTGIGRMLTRILGEDIHLELEVAERPLFVDADAGMIDQIILNLAVNSRDAMPHGGLLVIGTSEKIAGEPTASSRGEARSGPYACISVSDTGEGIPREVLPHIFEPFFSTKAPGKGTGLGLATVFGIAKQHHGWIDVESEVGEGTTFRVWLPLSETQAPQRPTKAVAAASGGSETVLLVEDEAAVLDLMRAALQRKGYTVFVASSGAEALKIWHGHAQRIQLLITDIVLPLGMSGRELVAQLRAERPTLKVLFVSGYSSDFAGTEFRAGAGEDFLQKPFTPNRFVESVRACLDSPTGGTLA